MQVKVKDTVLHVSFRHGTYIPEGPRPQRERRFTKCLIEVEGTEKGKLVEFAEGTARTFVGDVFTREGGRKAALKKALATRKLGRDARRTIWLAYHSRPRTVSTPPSTQTPPATAKPTRLTSPVKAVSRSSSIPAPLSANSHRVVSKVVNMPDRWTHDLEHMAAISGTH